METMTEVIKKYKWHVEGKLGLIVRYMSWRHQIKVAGRSFKTTQRTMALLAKGVGAVELCQQDTANAPRGHSSFTEEKPAGDYDIQNSPSCPDISSGENCWRTGKFQRLLGSHVLICFGKPSVTN